MRVGIKEWISTCREYEMDFTEKDLGEINIYIMMHTDEPFKPLEMDEIRSAYEYNTILGKIRFRGNRYDTDLTDFIREWIDEDLWNTEPYEKDWNTDDVERWSCNE